MKLSKLKLNPNNPRFVKDYKFDKLKNSLKEFPQMMELRPIIVDENYVVLGGNMRFRALKDLGYKDIPDNWIKVTELSEAQKQEFIIKDNISFGDWDYDMLANNFDDLKLMDWGLDLPIEMNSLANSEPQNDIVNRDITNYLEIRIIVAKSIKGIEQLNDLFLLEKGTIDEDIRQKLSREKSIYYVK